MEFGRDAQLSAVAPDDWDSFVSSHPDAHVLQTSPWGTLKSRFGWEDERVGLSIGGELVAGAQVLYRRLPAGLGRLAYVPRGPLAPWENAAMVAHLLKGIGRAARARGAIALMIEPQTTDTPAHSNQLRTLGFQPSPLTIQPRRTIVVDIAGSEEAILKAMKSKTRYNIRLAGRKGVIVREAGRSGLASFCQLVGTTGARDEFAVHAPAYYEGAFDLFAPRGWARLLMAEVEGEAVAGIMVFAVPPNAWYLFGASGDAHREKMPNYLLQWRAIEWAKSLGCTSYDLWGVPDFDLGTLEDQFARRSDGLWGVYRFKRGFGGRLTRTTGAWDQVYAPVRYRLYRWGLGIQRRMRQATVSDAS